MSRAKEVMRGTLWALALICPIGAIAQEACGPVPIGEGGDWFRAYQKWCRACGGVPSEDASPATCKPGEKWRGPAAGAAGTSLVEQSLEYGVRSGDVGGALLGVGVGVLTEGLFAADDSQARQRQLDQERQQALDRAQAEDRANDALRQRVVAQLKGVDRPPTEPENANPLGLKLASAQAPAPAPSAPPASAPSRQGLRDATACFEPRPALYCMNDPNRASCEKNYRVGYANGAKARDARLNAAYQSGRAAKAAGDTSPHTEAFQDARADDSCRVKLVNEYSRGYAEAP